MSRPVDAHDAAAIRAALSGRLIGKEVLVVEETTSTNDVVAQHAGHHDEGLVVIAEQQTAGRGQYGRRWESAPGSGLWLSILLRPAIQIAQSSRLTNFLARAISETITAEVNLPAAIKPPNDVYVQGRKVAGVLVEMRVEPSGSYCAIAGLGINVNHQIDDFPEELQATAGSLAMAAGRRVDRAAFTIALLRKLDEDYRTFGSSR